MRSIKRLKKGIVQFRKTEFGIRNSEKNDGRIDAVKVLLRILQTYYAIDQTTNGSNFAIRENVFYTYHFRDDHIYTAFTSQRQ